MPQSTLNRLHVILAILALAICAFEIFNFDTTRFALHNLFDTTAFCGIDLAGLMQIFSLPAAKQDSLHSSNFLFGAWLLGATLNAIMTWYAVGLTLVRLDIGNELLSRHQLVAYVPILIAMLVWLTRILFIGALTLMGNELSLPARQPIRVPVEPVAPRRQQAILRETQPLQPSRAAQRARADVTPVAPTRTPVPARRRAHLSA